MTHLIRSRLKDDTRPKKICHVSPSHFVKRRKNLSPLQRKRIINFLAINSGEASIGDWCGCQLL